MEKPHVERALCNGKGIQSELTHLLAATFLGKDLADMPGKWNNNLVWI